jgi:uncharacterized protein YigA (DUF484 family)
MTSAPGELTTDSIDEETVAEYLRAHPDFLLRHPSVLAEIEAPHHPDEGTVTSLIERQVAVLRERNARLEERLAELLRTARENERVGARLLALGRSLLEADSLDAVLATVRETLLSEFAADEVALRLIDSAEGARAAREPARFIRPEADEVRLFDDFLHQGEPVCGEVSAEQQEVLFGESAKRVASVALVPLNAGRPLGVVGVGSADPNHFRPEMGTLFLGQLGELVSAGIAAHLGEAGPSTAP